MSYEIKDSHEGFTFGWNITIRPNSYPVHPKVSCPCCLGRGRNMGYDFDTIDCTRCNGSGEISDPTWEWKPKPPQELVDRLKKVYMEYWNEQQNKEFTLK